MNMFAGSRWAVRLLVIGVVACLYASRAEAQINPNQQPTYGSVTLKSGFTPDPFSKQVVAGGPNETKLGGVKAFVANAPDFQLNYTAGSLPLTIHVESDADTTLLINLPDGTWVADDDSGGKLNPLLRFAQPQSGRYDIYVGTVGRGNPPAMLFITERK
jgi:hypothetical protein